MSNADHEPYSTNLVSYPQDRYNDILFVVDHDEVAKLFNEKGIYATPVLPVIKHNETRGDSGIDLYAPYGVTVGAGDQAVINTCLRFMFPTYIYARILPRGGDKFVVGSGVIDTGYTGVLKVRIINPYGYDMVIQTGDSIGQLVPMLKAFPGGIPLKMASPEEWAKQTSTFGTLYGSTRGHEGRINRE